MASFVGRTTIPPSGIAGSRPSAPVPTIRRRQRHGMFLSSERGVWPHSCRYCLEAFMLRFRTSPRSMTTSYS